MKVLSHGFLTFSSGPTLCCPVPKSLVYLRDYNTPNCANLIGLNCLSVCCAGVRESHIGYLLVGAWFCE